MQRAMYEKETHFRLWQDFCSGHPWLDPFCSSPYWGLPLCSAFQADSELVCYLGEKGLGVFAERTVPGGVLTVPTDGMWLLGSPLLSGDPIHFFQDLVTFWRTESRSKGIRQVLISGMFPGHPLEDSKLWSELSAWELEPSGRMIASLEGGLDGFMSRRSKNFRSRLRRTVKAAEEGGVTVEFMPSQATAAECRILLRRLFQVEEQSWKGLSQRGIDQGGMKQFYQEMVPMLAADGRLRGLYLQREGQDIAYLLGAGFDGYFRGLQFSYLAQESQGMGNVGQYYMIRRLVDEGCNRYDLGQAMAYKTRWAEDHIYSRSFVFQV